MAKKNSNVLKIREQLSTDIQIEKIHNDEKVLLIKTILDKDFTYEEMSGLKNYLRTRLKLEII